MTLRFGPVLAKYFLLWLIVTTTTPTYAFNDHLPRGHIKMAEDSWTQLFDQNRRRDLKLQQRMRSRNNDTPFRTNAQRFRMRELRRQKRQQQEDQNRAREAVRRGDIMPLERIIRSIRSYCPGTFLNANLQHARNGIIYRVRILRPSGKRVVLMIQAKSGAVISGQCK